MHSLITKEIPTPIGSLLAAVYAGGGRADLVYADFIDDAAAGRQVHERLQAQYRLVPQAGRHDLLEEARAQLDAYFCGKLREFRLSLAPRGTAFQHQVWALLGKIPYGETRTYSEQAALYGNPRAVRAVAAANGRNPLSIIVPCHRVIGKDGALTGYSGGLARKAFLLELEQRYK